MNFSSSAITNFGHKGWSARDRARLQIAYKMGACLKVISRVVKRSVTATNKALSRFGLRTYFGNRRDMMSNLTKSAPTYEQIMAEIESYEVLHHIEERPNNSGDRLLLKSTIKLPILETPLPTVSKKSKDILVKFQKVIEDAKRSGVQIKKLSNSQLNSMGYEYLINGKPAKQTDILVAVNKVRQEQGSPIFHVKGITLE